MKKYLLSEEQKRLWFEWKRSPQSHAYNTSMQFKINGKLDIDNFRQALLRSVQYFDSFRSYFIENGANVEQVISQNSIDMDFIDYSNDSKSLFLKDEIARDILTTNLREPFDFTVFPLVKFILIKTGADTFYFGFYTPHILLDANSASKFLEFISCHYNNDNVQKDLFWENKCSFEQYYECIAAKSQELDADKITSYWAEYLEGHNLNFNLGNFSELAVDIAGERIHFTITKEEYLGLKQIASNSRTTIFSVLLGLFNTILYRYYMTEDIVTSYPVSTRDVKLKNFFGFFANNTAIRILVDGQRSFQDLVSQIDSKRKNSKNYTAYPFNKIISSFRKGGAHISNNILNTSVAQTNFSLSKLALNELNVKSLPLEFAQINNDLTLMFDSEYNGDVFEMALEYRFSAVSKDKAGYIINSIKALIKEVVKDSSKPIDHINVADNANDLILTLSTQNDNLPYANKTIFGLFAQQVKSNPRGIAIICKGSEITFDDLNKKVSNIALALIDKGIKESDFVGVFMERSIDMVATLLAILKVGAAYIPLDINHPKNRILEIYNDSGCKLIVVDYLRFKLPESCNILSDIKVNSDQGCDWDKSSSNNPAYVIYTSGSTGKPKGVLVSHKNACARLFWIQDKIGLSQDNKIITHFNTSFDVSVCDMFTPLCFGGVSILVGQEELKDQKAIKNLITQYQVNNIFSVPSLLNVFLDQLKPGDCQSLKKVFVGGEKHTQSLQEKFYKYFNPENTGLYNVYGPTECTILATCFDCIAGTEYKDSIPIGKPVSNTQIYILNNALQKQPTYGVGEIYIGGDSVALGYLNNPLLTTKSFIHNPFQPGTYLYKTGDIGRYVKNGDIQFISRIDNQVKVRGFRIEIGEIEHAILQTGSIEQVAVILSSGKLVAYCKPASAVDLSDVKQAISTQLPEYMVPTYFVELDEIPLNSSGKLDIKNLPEPKINTSFDRSIKEPRNDLDVRIRNIWAKLLQTSPDLISITDKFYDIGGDSFMTVSLSLAIEEQLEIEFIVNKIFELPTIQSCTDFIMSQSLSQKLNVTNINDKRRAMSQYRQQRLNKKSSNN